MTCSGSSPGIGGIPSTTRLSPGMSGGLAGGSAANTTSDNDNHPERHRVRFIASRMLSHSAGGRNKIAQREITASSRAGAADDLRDFAAAFAIGPGLPSASPSAAG